MSDEQSPVLDKTLLDELAMVALPLVWQPKIVVRGRELSFDERDQAVARDAYALAAALMAERQKVLSGQPSKREPWPLPVGRDPYAED